MLDRLLESKAKRERSATGAIASITAHTAVIGAALYATAQPRAGVGKPLEVVRAVYFPQPTTPRTSTPTTAHASGSKHRLVFLDHTVDIIVPTIDVTPAATRSADFVPSPNGAWLPNAELAAPAAGGNGAFRADQVERQVALAPGSTPPRYPEVLRVAGIEGRVIARFIVDQDGRVEEGSIELASSDNQLFEAAVRFALGRMHFIPAETAGKKVRQLVEMPFVFTLSR